MATLSFDRIAKIATIDLAFDAITIQEIVDQFRDYFDEPSNLDLVNGIDAVGKQDLRPSDPGTKLVGITATLKDGWQLKAADRAGPTIVLVTIADGNIVALDEVGAAASPVVAAPFVSYVIESDVSAGLISANIDTLTVDVGVLAQHISNRKDIDFTGDDALGWQEVVYDDDGSTILARYDLYDETATRINETIGSFVLRNGMIASRRPSP